jgi:tetratricopeptide (TPR) repeat protein
LNTNNVSALINLEYGRHHIAGGTNAFTISDRTQSVLSNYRQNTLAVFNIGGRIDTPAYCLALGQQFTVGRNYRQAAQQYLRAIDLTPNNQFARAQLIRTFLQAQSPDRALEMIQEIRQATADTGLNKYAQMDLMSLEANALFTKGDATNAVGVIESGLQTYTNDPVMRDTAVQVYLNYAPFLTNLIPRLEPLVADQLLNNPTNLSYRFNAGTMAMLRSDWPAAISTFSDVLTVATNDSGARFNRALAYLRSDQLEEARGDYEVLLEDSPHDFRLNYGLGAVAEQQGRNADAVKHFENYLRSAPRNTTEYTNVTSRIAALKSP